MARGLGNVWQSEPTHGGRPCSFGLTSPVLLISLEDRKNSYMEVCVWLSDSRVVCVSLACPCSPHEVPLNYGLEAAAHASVAVAALLYLLDIVLVL